MTTRRQAETSAARIRRIRAALGESRAQFAERFARKVRTIEDWELERDGRATIPDPLVRRELDRLEKKIAERADSR